MSLAKAGKGAGRPVEAGGRRARRGGGLLLATVAVVLVTGGVAMWVYFSPAPPPPTPRAGASVSIPPVPNPNTAATTIAAAAVSPTAGPPPSATPPATTPPAATSPTATSPAAIQAGEAPAKVPASATPVPETPTPETTAAAAPSKPEAPAASPPAQTAEASKPVAESPPAANIPPASTPAAANAPPVDPPLVSGAQALAPAPDSRLIERGPNGFLPIIGRDGRQPWKVYARPFDLADKRPRIAIVLGDLGLSATQTQQAVRLPPAISLAFLPYARRLGEWIGAARNGGHEVLLDLPMEPADFPHQDPGPNALLTALSPGANLDRLNWIMSQGTGYIGFVGLMGGAFSSTRDDIGPVLAELKKRGLLYIDNHAAAQSAAPVAAANTGTVFAGADTVIDEEPTQVSIDRKLAMLEAAARRTGLAVGLAQPYAITYERLNAWAVGLEAKGIVLAPVSAVADRAMTQAQLPPQSTDAAAGAEK